jgi:hypothetical protein
VSSIENIARALQGVCRPITGDVATGAITLTATGSDVTIPRNTHAVPVINGQEQPDLVYKTAAGPNDDDSWTVTSGGDDVTFFSNIGGERHNVADTTPFNLDPEITGLKTTAVANGAFSGGTNPTAYGSLKDFVLYEQFDGPILPLDMRRSLLKGFPSALIGWVQAEPGDGSVTTHTLRETRTGTFQNLYRHIYEITVIINRAESDYRRRAEGMHIIETMSRLLTDRHSVDECTFSNPSGVQVLRMGRVALPQNQHQKFYVFSMQVSTLSSLVTTDTRAYNDWLLARIDILKPQDPALPNQGDYTVVNDMDVDMS